MEVKNDSSWNDFEQLHLWLLLHKIPGFGYQKLQQLYRLAGCDLRNIPTRSTSQFQSAGLPRNCFSELQNQYENYLKEVELWLSASPLHFVLPVNHPDYPPRLREISRPPMLLFGIGDPVLLQHPQLAIVGSRRMTPGGSKVARQLAADLVETGWQITSGLALGIDTQAHLGALDGNGITIAVMATGINSVYPRRNQQLAMDIVNQGGCLLSEFPLHSPPKKEHFPRRNRIISGLSNGVLVVEAAVKSGSLITARYALEQNREVFAVPGSVYNLSSQGCHYLIKQGAKLVEQVTDINEEFPNIQQIKADTVTTNPEKNCKLPLATEGLLASVGFEATSIDVVAQRSGLPVTAVMSELLEYELRGLVATVPGGYIRLGE